MYRFRVKKQFNKEQFNWYQKQHINKFCLSIKINFSYLIVTPNGFMLSNYITIVIQAIFIWFHFGLVNATDLTIFCVYNRRKILYRTLNQHPNGAKQHILRGNINSLMSLQWTKKSWAVLEGAGRLDWGDGWRFASWCLHFFFFVRKKVIMTCSAVNWWTTENTKFTHNSDESQNVQWLSLLVY